MYQRGVGNDFNISMAQSTFCVVFKEIRSIIEQFVCPKWITFSYSEEEIRKAKLYFYNKTKIPGVIGCVDGSHISIIKPKRGLEHLYYNRKGFHSLNTMIICDHNMKIKYVNAKYPGSCHDSMLWNLSQAKTAMKNMYDSNGRNIWLLGDSGYPLEPYLMTPFRSPVGNTQIKYNTLHSKGRILVERTIGVLKNSFRCLLGARQLHYSPETATQIVNCCAALHNMCISYRIESSPIEVLNESQDLEEILETEPNESECIREAERNRNTICNSL